MTEHQAFAAGRSFAVGAGDDLPIGAADAERERADQNRAVGSRRLGNLVEAGRIRLAGKQCDRSHRVNLWVIKYFARPIVDASRPKKFLSGAVGASVCATRQGPGATY